MDETFEQWKEQLQRTFGPRAFLSKDLLARQWQALTGGPKTANPSTDNLMIASPLTADIATTSPMDASALDAGPRAKPMAAPLATTHHTDSVPAAASETLAAIQSDLGDCVRCKLSKTRTHIVFGEGNPLAKLMFIGEGPGEMEDQQGRPFVGKAGQLLDKIIEAMGLKRADVYIANVVKCRPPGNRLPEPDEVGSCEPFLFRQIDVIRPQVMVALGGTALKCLFGDKVRITKSRGKFIEFRGAKLMPTFHPAFLLRNPDAKKEVWEDMKKVMTELGLDRKSAK